MQSVTSEDTDTVGASLDRAGALDRPRIAIPDEAADTLPDEGVVRVVAGDTTYHAPLERSLDGDLEVRGLYDNARLARTGEGENRLPAWVDDAGLDVGRTVHVDVVVPGEQYGLRAPGERAVYRVREGPDDDLASIASDLEDEE